MCASKVGCYTWWRSSRHAAARADEGGAGIGVGPGIAAVGGAVEKVDRRCEESRRRLRSYRRCTRRR